MSVIPHGIHPPKWLLIAVIVFLVCMAVMVMFGCCKTKKDLDLLLPTAAPYHFVEQDGFVVVQPYEREWLKKSKADLKELKELIK